MWTPRDGLTQRNQSQRHNLLNLDKNLVVVDILSLEIILKLLEGPLWALANNIFIFVISLFVMLVNATIIYDWFANNNI